MRTATKLALITLASAALVFLETAAMSVWGQINAPAVGAPRVWLVTMPLGWPRAPDYVETANGSIGTSVYAISNWTEIPSPVRRYSMVFVSWGWPSRAMVVRRLELDPTDESQPISIDEGVWHSGIELSAGLTGLSLSGSPRTSMLNRRIPLRPLWPGFAINTALHVLILSLPIFGLPAIRRALRRRDGHCTKCDYPLTGLPPGTACPECGQIPA